MNLEPIIQNEVSQKEKDQYHILMHVYRIYTDSADEPICRAAIETQTERTDLCTQRLGEEGEGEMKGDSSMEAYRLLYVKQIANGNLPYDSGNSNWGSATT